MMYAQLKTSVLENNILENAKQNHKCENTHQKTIQPAIVSYNDSAKKMYASIVLITTMETPAQ